MTTQVKNSHIEELMTEHQAVLKMLDEMGTTLSMASQSNSSEWKASLEKACAFFRKEVVLHFRKEEEALFPALRVHLGLGAGPIEVMLREHQLHNSLFSQLQATVEAADLGAIRSVWESFNSLLTTHIMKEDTVLFPMADHFLLKDEWADVGRKMESLNNEFLG